MLQVMKEMKDLRSGCTFQTTNGMCELHDKGLKPLEGRLAHHSLNAGDLHFEVAQLWDNKKGQEIVEKWKKERGMK